MCFQRFPIFVCKLYVQSYIQKQKIMYRDCKDGVTVLTILDTRRPKQNGLYPVKVQVIFKRVQKYYSTGKELSIKYWERMPDSKSAELSKTRNSIKNSYDLILKNVEDLASKGEFSFDSLNVRLGKAAGEILNNTFKVKIEALEANEQINTRNYYQNVLNCIEQYAGNNFPLDSITVDWLRKFEKHLLQNRNYTTVGMYMRALKAIINDSITAGALKLSQYPFGRGKYEIPEGVGRKKALNLEQIAQIVKYSDDSEATEKYKDLWFFSYLCNGINIADLIMLKYNNIEEGEIFFIRKKTIRRSKSRKEIRASITPEMESIIKKWGNPKSPDSYIFPFLKGDEDAEQQVKVASDIIRRINRRMNAIGEALKIGKISTYTARHSFATVLKRSGTNLSFISESLGHANLKTTESYLASFEKEERQKNAALLTNF